jgi:hypothetical protein
LVPSHTVLSTGSQPKLSEHLIPCAPRLPGEGVARYSSSGPEQLSGVTNLTFLKRWPSSRLSYKTVRRDYNKVRSHDDNDLRSKDFTRHGLALPGTMANLWSRGVTRWFRCSLSVADPFVCRCLNSATMLPSSHLAHRTGRAERPHPALGESVTRSPTGNFSSAL